MIKLCLSQHCALECIYVCMIVCYVGFLILWVAKLFFLEICTGSKGLKWLGPQTPEHQTSFSSTCYPFIFCFSQPQIFAFYSSAIWQPPYIPLHHHGDKARGLWGMAVALVDRPTSRRPWQKLRVWCSQECRLAVSYWTMPGNPGSSFSLCPTIKLQSPWLFNR